LGAFMQQIIVDFGTLKFSSFGPTRFLVYGAVLALLLVWQTLAARAAQRAGRNVENAPHMTLIVMFAGLVGILEFLRPEVPLRIFGYGLALVFGFLTGIYLAQVRARRAGENPEHIAYCGLLGLIGGVVGARAAYVIERLIKEPDKAPRTLGQIIDIPSGGLVYYGGVALGMALVMAFLWNKRLPIRRFLDIAAPSLMVGLAFGRLGCLLNGCCYGAPCRSDWPLAMRFPMYSKPLVKLDGRANPYSMGTDAPSPPYASQFASGRIRPDPGLVGSGHKLIPPRDFTDEQARIAAGARSHPVKPAQLLGMMNALVLAAILVAFGRLRTREGQVFALLLILHPITRFLLESIRADNSHNVARGILTHNQYTSIFLAAIGIVFWLALYKLPASGGPTLAQRLPAGGGAGAPAPQVGRKKK